ANYYTVIAEANGYVDSCNSTSTSCGLTRLQCGENYTVTVLAGDTSPVIKNQSHYCTTNRTTVTWVEDMDAVSVMVNATSNLGRSLSCSSSTNNSCVLNNLQCGHTYMVQAVAQGVQCTSKPSTAFQIITAPCTPGNVEHQYYCGPGNALVSWDEALGRDSFYVRAQSGNHTVFCTASQDTDCSLPPLQCSRTYDVEVIAVAANCNSSVPGITKIQTVICPPTDMTAVTTCSNSDISVTWNLSPETGAQYFIHSLKEGGAAANYTTPQPYHLISGLHCAELYTFKVAAMNSQCSSIFSEQIQAETAPCPPTNLTVKTECGTNLATLTWAPSIYALSYTATFTGTHGHVVSCFANTTSCFVKVDCGRQYSAVVVASTATCNSSKSDALTFNSAPCLPERVEAELNCTANSFMVQWRGTLGDIGMYMAIAIGSDNSREICTTASNECIIRSLKCGVLYSIVVTTASIDCGTIVGSDYQMYSAPCKPDNVSVDLQCSTDMAFVTWGNSGPDQHQVVTAVDSREQATICNSSSSNCTLNQLECGKKYAISVVGYTNSCSSEPTINVYEQLQTNLSLLLKAPCIPTHVNALVDCDSGITAVTWDEALGATSYTVYARGSLGYNAECVSKNVNCDFVNLACGQDYNITVVARHDTCVSSASETITVSSGPCPHSSLKTSLDCITNTVMVSWTPGRGILNYSALADPFNTAEEQSCSTNGSSCNITSLRCGESYRVSLRVLLPTSGSTLPVRQTTSRCHGRPRRVQCPTWQWLKMQLVTSGRATPAAPPAKYLNCCVDRSTRCMSLVSMRPAGAIETFECNSTSDGMCALPTLACSQNLTFTLKAQNEQCTSAASNSLTTETANLICSNNVASMSWGYSQGGQLYTVRAVSTNGHESECRSPDNQCDLTDLMCGEQYTATVTAEDMECKSHPSDSVTIKTVPCKPRNIKAMMDCYTKTARVSWYPSNGALSYMVIASTASDHNVTCKTNMTSCELKGLRCGQSYSVSVKSVGESCCSSANMTGVLVTEPCPPNNVETNVNCQEDLGTVSWEASWGSEGYEVQLAGRDGHSLTCHTNTTFCNVKDLHCGVIYYTSVIAIGDIRRSPCTASNVVASYDCDNNTAEVSWSHGEGASSYMVTAVSPDGYRASCETNELQCELLELECGQTYNITLTTVSNQCEIETHTNVSFSTLDLQCGTSTANMFWGEDEDVELFMATAISSMGMTLQCNSTNSTCKFPDLQCGEKYVFSVTAYSNMCYSENSSSVEIQTGRSIIMLQVQSYTRCENSLGSISWTMYAKAESYLAIAVAEDGHIHECTTNTTKCTWNDLHCGEIYTVNVIALDYQCTSMPSNSTTIRMEPCPPTDVRSVLNCLSNIALLSWTGSAGAEFYTATVTAEDGHTMSCASDSEQCAIPNIQCGKSNIVTVVGSNRICDSDPSKADILQSASISCSQNEAVVSWNASKGALLYKVLAVSTQGAESNCATEYTNCTLTNLTCGHQYHVQVVAQDNICSSLPSPAVDFESVPCTPEDIVTVLDCYRNTALVEWQPSRGADSYIVQAFGVEEHETNCSTNSQSCILPDLMCGFTYNVSVIAINSVCNVSQSEVQQLQAVTWERASGALSYVAVGVTTDGGHRAECNNTMTYCDLSNLQCGQTYNVSVFGLDESCSSVESNTTYVRTGAMVISWSPNPDAQYFHVAVVSNTGARLYCNSSSNACTINSLPCGQHYNITVLSVRDTCESKPSAVVATSSGPCALEALSATVECNSDTILVEWKQTLDSPLYLVTAEADDKTIISCNSSSNCNVTVVPRCEDKGAVVSWAKSSVATSYQLMATGQDGHVMSCNNSVNHCSLADLHCGQTYGLSITAVGDNCTSYPSNSSFRTGPVSARRRRDLQPTQLIAYEGENLETPEVLAVTVSGGSMYVRWRMVKGATEYELIIEEEQKAGQTTQLPRVRNIDGDFYTETDLKPVTTYCVRNIIPKLLPGSAGEDPGNLLIQIYSSRSWEELKDYGAEKIVSDHIFNARISSSVNRLSAAYL
ncbi:hypothetical protein GOODEAATRI_000588, partial [Goodea atripinnis]